MVFIYILELENSKYYIGKTKNPQIRIDAHNNYNGSKWTKLYKPIKVVEIISDCDLYDEDKFTLKYMEKKGIDNVRGGSFSQIKLSEEQIKFIKQMIKGATDKCFNCGGDHFIKDCFESSIFKYLANVNENNIDQYINSINTQYKLISKLKKDIQLTNFICVDDLPNIKRYLKNDKIYKELLKEQNIIRQSDCHSIKLDKYLLCKKLESIEDQIREHIINKNKFKFNWNDKIKYCYIRTCCQHKCSTKQLKKCINERYEHCNNNRNIFIQGLEIISFNLQTKKRLKDIYKEYNSEEYIVALLTKLYEKKIQYQINKLNEK